jgi:hypothetical protein
VKPLTVEALTYGFRAVEPRLTEAWSRYPEGGADLDEACETLTKLFTDYARTVGVEAVTIVAGLDPDREVEYHLWTRLRLNGRLVNVDWTARQFENLEWPPNPAHQDLPCPLIWEGDSHPVVRFGRVAVA